MIAHQQANPNDEQKDQSHSTKFGRSSVRQRAQQSASQECIALHFLDSVMYFMALFSNLDGFFVALGT